MTDTEHDDYPTEEIDIEDLYDLPDYMDMGGNWGQVNSGSELEALQALESLSYNDRVVISVHDADSNMMIPVFTNADETSSAREPGISAGYLMDEMFRGNSLDDTVREWANRDIGEIDWYQIDIFYK